MNSFEELIKKKGNKYFNPKTKKVCKVVSIQTKDLGEWAWNEIYPAWKTEISRRYGTWEYSFSEFANWISISVTMHIVVREYWKIAVACLGEKEIKKRLEGI